MDSFIFCMSEFLLILLGYLLAWLYVSAPPVTEEEENNRVWQTQEMLFFYKWKWLYNAMVRYSHTLGTFLSRLWPSELMCKLTGQLKASGVRMPVEIFLTCQLLSSLVLPIMLYFWVAFLYCNFKSPKIKDGSMVAVLLALIMLGIILWFYQFWMIHEKAQKRQQAIIRTLPFAIDLIGSAMRSGQDFMAAVRFYVNNEDDTYPLVQEFGQVLRDMSGGKTREEAMKAMADRVQVEYFTTFVAAVVHGEKVGASLVQTLKNQGSMLRRERFALAQQKAEKATTMMLLPTVLILLPALMIALGFAAYMKLTSTFIGGI
jgi:Flp pilus assembly protein TadB